MGQPMKGGFHFQADSQVKKLPNPKLSINNPLLTKFLSNASDFVSINWLSIGKYILAKKMNVRTNIVLNTKTIGRQFVDRGFVQSGGYYHDLKL